MTRVTSDGQTRASTTSLLMSRTSHLRDLRQTGCDVMSVLVSQEADVLLANLAYGHDRLAQGMPGRVESTDTIFFESKNRVPQDRWKDMTYSRIVCDVREHKEETNRTSDTTPIFKMTWDSNNMV